MSTSTVPRPSLARPWARLAATRLAPEPPLALITAVVRANRPGSCRRSRASSRRNWVISPSSMGGEKKSLAPARMARRISSTLPLGPTTSSGGRSLTGRSQSAVSSSSHRSPTSSIRASGSGETPSRASTLPLTISRELTWISPWLHSSASRAFSSSRALPTSSISSRLRIASPACLQGYRPPHCIELGACPPPAGGRR